MKEKTRRETKWQEHVLKLFQNLFGVNLEEAANQHGWRMGFALAGPIFRNAAVTNIGSGPVQNEPGSNP